MSKTAEQKPKTARLSRKKLAEFVEPLLDPEVAADRAKLRYVNDTMPGITRHKAHVTASTTDCRMARWCATSIR